MGICINNRKWFEQHFAKEHTWTSVGNYIQYHWTLQPQWNIPTHIIE